MRQALRRMKDRLNRRDELLLSSRRATLRTQAQAVASEFANKQTNPDLWRVYYSGALNALINHSLGVDTPQPLEAFSHDPRD